MFEPNIKTVMNPFTVKQYDMNGNVVEETHWRYFVQTGEKIFIEDVIKYLTIEPKNILEEI
jgi:hypothetical protein